MIVRPVSEDYGGGMSRLLRLLLLLALSLMPLGLIPSGHMAAAAATQAAGIDHCVGKERDTPAAPAHHPAGHGADCALACSALPSVAGALAPPEPAPILLHPLPLVAIRGLAPEAATPPPRNS